MGGEGEGLLGIVLSLGLVVGMRYEVIGVLGVLCFVVVFVVFYVIFFCIYIVLGMFLGFIFFFVFDISIDSIYFKDYIFFKVKFLF